jgi:hypothetical protein
MGQQKSFEVRLQIKLVWWVTGSRLLLSINNY